MAIYRSIHTTFWTDTKVVDDFSPEDKYFMLYCLTNSYTNIIGCYEISVKQMANDLGYSKESVESLIKRFRDVHKVIDYDFSTKELFVKNWYKYNWTNSPKLDKPLLNEIEKVKNANFKKKIIELYNKRDTVSIPYPYPMDTTDTDTDTVSNTNTISNIDNISVEDKEIFDFWNSKKIIEHRNITDEIVKAIHNCRKNKQLTTEDIKIAIDRYSIMLNDNSYSLCSYKWKLVDFLKQSNAVTEFLDNGSKWLNYKSKPKDSQCLNQREYKDNDWTNVFNNINEIEV